MSTPPTAPTQGAAREHELKCWPEFYEKLLSRENTFEARKDDRGFRAGDVLWIREWQPKAKVYTGRDSRWVVTYLMTGSPFGVLQGFVVMSIAPERTQGAAQQDLTDEEIAHTERWLSPPPNTAIAIDVASRIARLLAEVKRRRAEEARMWAVLGEPDAEGRNDVIGVEHE